MTYDEAKKILKKNIIGPDELKKISHKLNISPKVFSSIPDIPFSRDFLKTIKGDCILILGISYDKLGKKISILRMRKLFGVGKKNSPTFYNQDWYEKETFASKNLSYSWYLVSKKIIPESRGKNIDNSEFSVASNFPSAVLTTFVFFCNYFLNNEILWKNDYVWCSDVDHNGDRIYVGRYKDPRKINKDGFSIHRYLKITHHYGLIKNYKI